MLIKTISKTVYPYDKNGIVHMNFPREAYERFGRNYLLEIHDDKVVMYPAENLGKFDNK